MSLFQRALAPFLFALLCAIAPAGASADSPTGGMAYEEEPAPPAMLAPGLWTGIEVPGAEAVLLEDGTAAAPAEAPDQVKQAIWAANSMQELPYRYGGGHNLKFDVTLGADCSGTVSFALRAGDLLAAPLDSGSFMRWGEKGKGEWITVYTNPGHAFIMIAGLRFDTGMRDNSVRGQFPGRGPRWAKAKRSTRGFSARHPRGF